MIRERALKVVLVLVGLIFTAAVYPLTMFFSREPALAMMLSHIAGAMIARPLRYWRRAIAPRKKGTLGIWATAKP